MMKIYLVPLCIFLSLSISAFSQEAKVRNTLEDIRTQVTKNNKAVDEAVLFKHGNETYVDSNIGILLSDTSASVRSRGISLAAMIAYKSADSSFRRTMVKNLITRFHDPDAGVTNRTARYLIGFKATDFDDVAKDSLRKLVTGIKYNYDLLLKIAGFANLRDQAPLMKSMITEGNLPPAQKWACILALARMGEQEYVTLCMIMVKKMPVNDNMMYNSLADLIYTRQHMIFDYLIELVNSDKTDCHSPNPNYSGKIMCAYRVMEALAGAIKDFPIKTSSSGDLAINNYEKALDTTRKWFAEHKDNYEIITNVY